MMLEWIARAVCRDYDPELWFPISEESDDVATGHCRTCPVRAECLEYALDIGAVGIWGGTTTAQRRQIRARRATNPPRPAVTTTRRQPNGAPWTAWQDQQLLDLLDDGVAVDEVACRLGRATDDVYRRARELRRRRPDPSLLLTGPAAAHRENP